MTLHFYNFYDYNLDWWWIVHIYILSKGYGQVGSRISFFAFSQFFSPFITFFDIRWIRAKIYIFQYRVQLSHRMEAYGHFFYIAVFLTHQKRHGLVPIFLLEITDNVRRKGNILLCVWNTNFGITVILREKWVSNQNYIIRELRCSPWWGQFFPFHALLPFRSRVLHTLRVCREWDSIPGRRRESLVF